MAWSGRGWVASPSVAPRLGLPAAAWSVRSLARRSFLAASAALRASESWVSFIGTTRRRASSSITSTSARVSSRSIVFATFNPLIRYGATARIDKYPKLPTPEAVRLCLEYVSWLRIGPAGYAAAMSIVKSPGPGEAQWAPAKGVLWSVSPTLIPPPRRWGHPPVAAPPQPAPPPIITTPPLTVRLKPGGRALGTG